VKRILIIAAITATLLAARPSSAETPDEPAADRASTSADTPLARDETSPYHVDAEVDPTAYVLSGYSLHLGLGYRRVRLDFGAYAIDIPEFMHGNQGFDAAFNGFGLKLQLFVLGEQRGPFVGVDFGVSRVLVVRSATNESDRQTQLGPGVNLGWRISLPAGFYVTPWVGVSYAFNSRDVMLGGAKFASNPVTVFPAIHLGYRFQ
jgi:hypothetical protein